MTVLFWGLQQNNLQHTKAKLRLNATSLIPIYVQIGTFIIEDISDLSGAPNIMESLFRIAQQRANFVAFGIP